MTQEKEGEGKARESWARVRRERLCKANERTSVTESGRMRKEGREEQTGMKEEKSFAVVRFGRERSGRNDVDRPGPGQMCGWETRGSWFWIDQPLQALTAW